MNAMPVLVVDDEKNIRLTVCQTLESMDLKVDAAVNGEEALAKLKTSEFGLIFLDLKMPGMDGMEVLRRVREILPDIHVVIITAHGTIESAVEAMKLGAVDFLQKPFSPGEIRDLVRKAMDKGSKGSNAAEYGVRIERSTRYVEERRFDAAVDCLRRAISLDPSRPEAFNLLGALREIQGDVLEAQKNYRTALSLDPTYDPAQKNLNRSVGRRSGEGIILGKGRNVDG